MKEDIVVPTVERVGIAILYEQDEEGNVGWNSYLINLRDKDMEGVIVASKGYDEAGENQRKTSMLRHYFEELPTQSYLKIEPIIDEVLGMFNEYWLTFFEGGKMYDRKFVFVPESISEENFTEIPLIGGRGVLIL